MPPFYGSDVVILRRHVSALASPAAAAVMTDSRRTNHSKWLIYPSAIHRPITGRQPSLVQRTPIAARQACPPLAPYFTRSRQKPVSSASFCSSSSSFCFSPTPHASAPPLPPPLPLLVPPPLSPHFPLWPVEKHVLFVLTEAARRAIAVQLTNTAS